MSQGIGASLVVASHNRGDRLSDLLSRAAAVLDRTEASCELVLVADASTDATATVACAAQVAGPRLRDPYPGLSRVRMTGRREACGNAIVRTDDDLGPDPDRLSRMCAPIPTGRSDAAGARVQLGPELDTAQLTPRT